MGVKTWVLLSEFCALYEMKVGTVKDACLKGRITSCRKTSGRKWELHKVKAFQEFHDNKRVNQFTKTVEDRRNQALAQMETQRQYELEQLDKTLEKQTSGVSMETPAQITRLDSEAIPNLETSKSRKGHYDAQKSKAEYEKTAGNLVDLRDVRKTYREIAKTIKDNLLKVPDRVSPLIAVETDERTIMNMLDREIREALEFLSKGL